MTDLHQGDQLDLPFVVEPADEAVTDGGRP